MKRIIITFITCMCMSICALAADGPGLESEKFFGPEFRNMKGVELTIVTQKNSYYRNLTVRENPGLVAKILKAVNKDSDKAEEVVQRYKEGSTHIVLNFDVDGGQWTLSFQELDAGKGCRLFLNRDKPARSKRRSRTDVNCSDEQLQIYHDGECLYVTL